MSYLRDCTSKSYVQFTISSFVINSDPAVSGPFPNTLEKRLAQKLVA